MLDEVLLPLETDRVNDALAVFAGSDDRVDSLHPELHYGFILLGLAIDAGGTKVISRAVLGREDPGPFAEVEYIISQTQ